MATHGSCACGKVEFEYSGEPTTRALCHCIDCRKWTGAAYTANAIIPRGAFKLTKGTPKTWDAVGDTGKINKHYFCGDCGSGLYTELEIMPDLMCVKAGTLDGGAANLDNKVDIEFYTKDRLGYLQVTPGAKQEPVFG